MALEYWLRGDIPTGPIKAAVLTDVRKIAETLVRFKGSTVLLLGSQLSLIEEIVGDKVVERLIKIVEIIDGDAIVSDSKIVQRIDAVGYRRYKILFPLEAVRSLSYNNQKYKLALLAGFKYSYAWLLLNHIKHYNPSLYTLSLDPYPQPNATWTLPPLPLQIWFKNLMQLIDTLKTL
ncbi:MAG: hypothetical protein N3D82_04665 [Ignisphaera sp.]|nr:hypothetical protein [Ignisphaera sp.]MCX8168302.1 hypothetical protein [Ignisphaera sp.]MDW8085878.1 carbon monoxide dehydrogenase beta subunit family protein [Ignisphaera sp.]